MCDIVIIVKSIWFAKQEARIIEIISLNFMEDITNLSSLTSHIEIKVCINYQINFVNI